MIIQLPLSNDPSQRFVTQLGDTKYQFDVRWNDRSGKWVMDLTVAATQVLLLAGVPLVLGADLLQPYVLGIGHMIAFDESGASTDAGPDDLGTRVNVYWFSTDELVVP